ncbi:MAG: TonB family protein [Desulfovibrio sp.]|jgi:protein TonB|nr:TonB family protein [Desulfovibrio sp.]
MNSILRDITQQTAPTAQRALRLGFLCSVCLHGGIVGALLFFPDSGAENNGQIFQVSLVEFARPGVQGASVPEPPEAVFRATSSPPAFAPEPEVAPPPPEPKIISPRRKPPERTRPAPKPAASSQRPADATGEQSSSPGDSSGPPQRQLGGFSAHDQNRVDQRPSIVRRVAPEYPARARRMRIEGVVVVELVVDAAGLPRACAVRSAEPPGHFEQAALDAAQKTRFLPGKIKGVSINTLVLLPFAFKLR